MKNFLVALSFLTRIPLKMANIEEKNIAGSATYFPFVGLILGLVLSGIYYFFLLFLPPFASAVLTFAAYLFLTGCLHLDGFADTVDGLYGGKNKEDIFKIMDDSRVGAIGVSWLFILLILKVFLIISFSFSKQLMTALIIMPVLSRFGMVVEMYFAPYAKESGLGKAFCKKISFGQLVVVFCFSFLTGVVFGWKAFAAFLVVTGLSVLITLYFIKKLGGITGDVIGFTAEVLEIAVLITLTIKLF